LADWTKRKAVTLMIERFREIQERKSAGNDSNYGFTLIELLIVIIVLGILAAIVVLSLGGVTGESKAAACNAEAHTVQIADDEYNADPSNNGAWSPDIATLVTDNDLKTAPSDDGYTLSVSAATTDIPQVLIAPATTPVAFNATSGGCNSLG
jgi:prepilin-type N-terminal cleavage/methylation domain-containing protein